jgi:hypothetical protein
MINGEVISKLYNVCSDGMELEMIQSCVKSFHDYHKVIYDMETFIRFKDKDMSREDYQYTFTNYDTRRTTCHNIVIQNIGILNRMAKSYGLEPVYTGEVSTQKPYRRILANEVLEYVEQIVKDRK